MKTQFCLAMKSMGDKSKAVTNVFKGKTEFDREIAANAAAAFVTHGYEMLEQFPDKFYRANS
ncbi:MAG: hypothetical protein AB8B63_18845 [Granulosicoccus sp.]